MRLPMICCRVGLAGGVYFCKYFKTLALLSFCVQQHGLDLNQTFSSSLFYVRNAIDGMVLDAFDQDIPTRPKIYFSFSKTEPRLYSLTNGFPGKSLGQLTSG